MEPVTLILCLILKNLKPTKECEKEGGSSSLDLDEP